MHLPQYGINIIIVLSIIIGAIQCFFGYRFFKVILGLVGFILGGSLAANFIYGIYHNKAVALLAALFGGFIGSALMVALYFIGIFLIGALLGWVLGLTLFAAGNYPESAVLLIFAVVAGVIALIFQKFMIIVSTGFLGAWSVVMGIAYFNGIVDPTDIDRIFRLTGSRINVLLFCWFALGIIGVIVQYKSVSQKEKEARKPAPSSGKKTGASPPPLEP